MDYQPKFQMGQLVHYVGDPAGLNGTVKAIHFTENGIRYDITSQDVDVLERKLLEGVKANLTEEELEEVTEETAVKEEE